MSRPTRDSRRLPAEALPPVYAPRMRRGSPTSRIIRAGFPLASAALLALCASGCRTREAADERAEAEAPEPHEAHPEVRDAPPLPEAVELPEDPGGHAGTPVWAIRFGGPGRDAARGIAALGDGAVVAGYVSSEATIGDHTHRADGIGAYVTRIDGDGNHLWTRLFGGEGDDIANSVAITENGNIVVAGAFGYDLTIGEGVLESAGADDIFVAKLSPDGERIWARAFGGRDVDAAHYVAAGPGGRIYVTGVFRDEVRFGQVTLTSEGDADIFVLALSSEGEPLWARSFGARGADYGRAIAAHPQGVALLAEFSLEVELGAETLKSAGNRDLLIALLDPHGEPIWAKRFGGVYHEVGVGLAVDGAGDLIVTGSFDDEIDFGGGPMRAAGQSDAFLLKLDAAGRHLWSRRIGDKEEDVGSSVAVDRYGNVIAAGWFWYEADLGGPKLTSAGRRDGYVAKLSPEGEHLWSHSMGGELGDMARAVAVGRDGRVFVAGTFHRTARFGEVELTTASEAAGSQVPYGDAFVALFEP
jgi:hypothetical protein